MVAVDTIYEVETPEGIMLHMRVAGLTARASAYMVDFMIRWGVNIAFSIIIQLTMGDAGNGLFLIFLFFNEWFYPVYFEVFKNGKTPGKKAMKLRVVHGDGTPIGWQASLTRNLLLIVDFLPLFYGFAIISSLLDKRFRRLGDLAADTVVVYEKEIKNLSLPDGEALHPSVDLVIAEQKAIIAFAERHELLSEARKAELAEILIDIHGYKKSDAINTVHAYALSLAGKGK